MDIRERITILDLTIKFNVKSVFNVFPFISIFLGFNALIYIYIKALNPKNRYIFNALNPLCGAGFRQLCSLRYLKTLNWLKALYIKAFNTNLTLLRALNLTLNRC